MTASCLIFPLIFQITSIVQCGVIVHHVRIKPPSVLTVIDLVVSDLSLMVIVYQTLTGSLMMVSLFVIIPDNLTLTLILMVRLMWFLTAFHWLAKSVLKYCYIFHWTRMVDICDSRLLTMVRSMSLLLSLCIIGIELYLVPESGDLPLLHYPVCF